jgi:hypothetical protein
MTKSYDEAAHASNFIKHITCLTGISESKLKKYASENNLFNVLEHPNTIDPSKKRGHALFVIGSKRLHVNFEIPLYKFEYMGQAGGRLYCSRNLKGAPAKRNAF